MFRDLKDLRDREVFKVLKVYLDLRDPQGRRVSLVERVLKERGGVKVQLGSPVEVCKPICLLCFMMNQG